MAGAPQAASAFAFQTPLGPLRRPAAERLPTRQHVTFTDALAAPLAPMFSTPKKAKKEGRRLFPWQTSKEVNVDIFPSDWRDLVREPEIVYKGDHATIYRVRARGTDDVYLAIKAFDISSNHDEMLGHVDRELSALRLFAGRDIIGYMGASMTKDARGKKHVYIMMERVDGNLNEAFQKLDWQQVSKEMRISMAIELLRGAAKLSEAGYLHRDMTPDNVFVLADPPGQLHVKLGGFGHFASAVDLREPETAQKAGPVGASGVYMAPEVRWGYPFTTKSDSWGLGMVILELFSMGRWSAQAQEQLRVEINQDMAERIQGNMGGFWDVRDDPRYKQILREDKEVARLIRRLCARRTWNRWSAKKALEWAKAHLATERGIAVPKQPRVQLPAKSFMTFHSG